MGLLSLVSVVWSVTGARKLTIRAYKVIRTGMPSSDVRGITLL
jgi:hypothetical protein